jgi:hypothetical protein
VHGAHLVLDRFFSFWYADSIWMDKISLKSAARHQISPIFAAPHRTEYLTNSLVKLPGNVDGYEKNIGKSIEGDIS